MTRFHRSSVVLLLVLAIELAAPAKTHAWKIWGWLDELSGPGPFRGAVFTAEVACLGAWNPNNDRVSVARRQRFIEVSQEMSRLQTLNVLDEESLSLLNRLTLDLGKNDPLIQSQLELATQVLALSNLNLGTRSDLTSNEYVTALKGLERSVSSMAQALGDEQGRHDKEISQQRWCYLDRSNALGSLQVEYGVWDDDQTRQRYTGDTKLTSIFLLVYIPLPRIWTYGTDSKLAPGLRAIDVGTGFGAYRLSGTTIRDVNLWRGVVPVRARIMPSEFIYSLLPRYKNAEPIRTPSDMAHGGVTRRYLQSIRAFVGHEWVVSDIDPRAFAPEAAPTTPRDKLLSWGVEIDLGLILRGVARK